MKRRQIKFDRRGPMAIKPQCWGLDFLMFDDAEDVPPFEDVNGVAVVTIDGPMTHHEDWWCDSYDGIKDRVEAACKSDCKSILLAINSPGGECSGCFDTAREIRDMAAAAKKPLFAFVDGDACSGGYALACAAEKIYLSETSFVGSIGVVATLVDASGLDAQYGLNVQIITSGDRKADGNPHVKANVDALAALQADVNSLAQLFFAWVAESRGITADDARALEAGVFHGQKAIEVGLADELITKKSLLAMLASGETSNGPSAAKEDAMGWKDEMKKAAEEGDEDAKKALAALEGEEKKDDEKEKSSEEEKKDEKTEGEEPEKKDDEKDDKDAKASADILSRLGKVERENAELKAKNEASERSEILSKRTDLTPSQVDYLSSLSLPAMTKALAAFPPPPPDPAAASKARPTQGAGGSDGPRLPPTEATAMQVAMGMRGETRKVSRENNEVFFPAMTPAEAKAQLDARAKEGAK